MPRIWLPYKLRNKTRKKIRTGTWVGGSWTRKIWTQRVLLFVRETCTYVTCCIISDFQCDPRDAGRAKLSKNKLNADNDEWLANRTRGYCSSYTNDNFLVNGVGGGAGDERLLRVLASHIWCAQYTASMSVYISCR